MSNAANASDIMQAARNEEREDGSAMIALHRFGSFYYPILVVGGVLGNIMAMIGIHSNRAMRKTRTKFILLAAADTSVLLFNPPRYFFIFTIGFDVRNAGDVTCKLHTFLAYWARDVATWVLVLISFERLIATGFPYHIAHYQRSKTAALIWISVMLALLLKNATLLHFITIMSLPNKSLLCDTDKLMYRKVFMAVDSFVYCVIPSICLFACNGGIMYFLERSRRKFESQPSDNNSARSSIRRSSKFLHTSNNSVCSTPEHRRTSDAPKRSHETLRVMNSQPAVKTTERTFSDLCSLENSTRNGYRPNSVPSVSFQPSTPARSRSKPRSSGNSLATSLLIPVSAFHLLTTLPFAITSVFEAALNIRHGDDLQSINQIQTFGSFFLMLAYLNNGLDCAIYLIGSRRFREHCWSLLRQSCSRNSQKLNNTGMPSKEVSRIQLSSLPRRSSMRSMSVGTVLYVPGKCDQSEQRTILRVPSAETFVNSHREI